MTNKLDHLKEFQQILKDYQISAVSKKTLDDTTLMLFAAATSAGRNTIFDELVKTGRYHYIVSNTTRKPRVNNGVPEKDGVEYWFISEDEMLSNLKEGKMLEAAIIHGQQVSGISIEELEKAHDDHKIAITDIEVVGADTIVKAKPDTKCLFIVPPNFTEWQKRLRSRGKMDDSESKRRLESAVMEFQTALEKDYYWIIVNDDLEDVVKYIDNIAKGLPSSEGTQAKNRDVLKQLLVETQEYLQTLA